MLTARPLARVTLRGRDPAVQPGTYWDRPVTLLINERSFSDAEVFPFMFKEAKCGKVVGVPTAGGVIGTNDITLSDGSTFRVPRTGFQSMDGRDLEGMGIKPDFLVAETSEDRIAGRDPQLDKAIEVVLAEIAEREKAAPSKPKEEPKQEPSPAPPQNPTAGAKADETPSNPLFDAQVGEWVRVRMTAPGGQTAEITRRVLSVTDDEVTIGLSAEGHDLPPQKKPRNRLLVPQDGSPATYGHEKLTVAGREFDCVTMTYTREGAEEKAWFCAEVPVTGVVRAERAGTVVLELLAWGKD